MEKRSVSLMAQLVLLITILVGCGSDSGGETSTPSSESNSTASVAPTTQGVAGETEASEEKAAPPADPLSVEQITTNLTAIQGNKDPIAVANTMIAYPSLPNPEGATINTYEAEVAPTLLGEAIVNASFAVFTGKSVEESVEFYTAEMEKAGWEVDPEDPARNTDSSTLISATPTGWPDALFEITVYGDQYRGEVLAISQFSQNGAPYADVGSPETWSAWYKDQIVVPDGGTVVGGGVESYAVPSGAQENITGEDGNTLLVSLAYPSKTDEQIKIEIAEMAADRGFEVTENGDEIVLTNSSVEVTYSFRLLLDTDTGGVRVAAKYLS